VLFAHLVLEKTYQKTRRQALRSCALQVELKSGETYRGELNDAEDNWNCQLKNVTATARVRATLGASRFNKLLHGPVWTRFSRPMFRGRVCSGEWWLTQVLLM